MRFMKVSVTDAIKFGKNVEIVKHPNDSTLKCIKQDDQYYEPIIIWTNFEHETNVWISMDDEEEKLLSKENKGAEYVPDPEQGGQNSRT